MARKTLKWNRSLTIAVEVLGLGLSFYLLLISLKIVYPGEVPCPRGKIFHCSTVLRGPWSKVGPIPISLLGVLYYLAHLFLSATWEKRRVWITRLKIVFVLGGLGYIAWLRAIEFVWLKGLCPWCWAVALSTLVQAFLVYPLASPPLPRGTFWTRVGYVVGGWLILVVLSVGIGAILYTREQIRAREELGVRKQPSPGEKKSATLPKPTAAPIKETVRPASTATPTPSHKTLPPTNDGSVEEGVAITNEVKLLVKHGWTVVASTESVNRYIKEEAPVLLLVFDPWCEECQAFIRGGLETDVIRRQPVKLVAIEQSSLDGPLSSEVQNVPTLFLIDRNKNILFKHVGRMTTDELVRAIDENLRPH